MTVAQIRSSASKSLTEGNGWPPSLPEFIALGTESIDYDAAYSRCIRQKPEGRVEQYVYDDAYFNIKTQSDKDARRDHRRFMRDAENLELRGELVLKSEELLALPMNKERNMNDIERQKQDEKTGGKLHPRIAKLLGKK